MKTFMFSYHDGENWSHFLYTRKQVVLAYCLACFLFGFFTDLGRTLAQWLIGMVF